MILVRTKLLPSSTHGIGLFAAEFIPFGTKVWEFTPCFDLALTKMFVDSLSPGTKNQVRRYAYVSKISGLYILCSDDARFMNHSDLPNVKNVDNQDGGEITSFASRDIFEGEEITTNYRELENDAWDIPAI